MPIKQLGMLAIRRLKLSARAFELPNDRQPSENRQNLVELTLRGGDRAGRSEGRAGIGSHEGCTACGRKRSADLMRCSDVGVWHGKRAGQGYSQSGTVAAAHQAGGTGQARQKVIWAQGD